MYSWNAGAVPRVMVALFCGGLLYALTQTVFKEPIEAYESGAYRRVAKGFRNPRRVRDAPLRISFLTLSFVFGFPILFVYITRNPIVFDYVRRFPVHIVLVSYFLILLTTIMLYLLACDPLPPCPGRLKQWVRGSAAVRVTSP